MRVILKFEDAGAPRDTIFVNTKLLRCLILVCMSLFTQSTDWLGIQRLAADKRVGGGIRQAVRALEALRTGRANTLIEAFAAIERLPTHNLRGDRLSTEVLTAHFGEPAATGELVKTLFTEVALQREAQAVFVLDGIVASWIAAKGRVLNMDELEVVDEARRALAEIGVFRGSAIDSTIVTLSVGHLSSAKSSIASDTHHVSA